MKVSSIFATTALLALTGAAFAQPYYLTGQVTNPEWSPGPAAPPTNGGAIGDGSSVEFTETGVGTNIFTLTQTIAQHGLTPGNTYEYKVSTTGFSPAFPNDNAKVVAPNGTIVWTLDLNAQGDGFIPDVGVNGENGIVYNDAIRAYVDGAASVQVVGAFQTENGGAADWDPADSGSVVTLTDGDNDGFYTGSITGIPAGSYDYKITVNGAFGADFGAAGLGGNNLSFTSANASDTISFTLDANTGRSKDESAILVAGPPFYAQDALAPGAPTWGASTFDSATVMTDEGGWFSKVATVAVPGDHRLRVRQGVGRSFPDTGDYVFTTTVPNQDVLIILDRTPVGDGYSPDVDFVLVLDDVSRAPLNTFSKVQPVGDWQSEFGASDFDAGVAAMDMKDDGIAPDTANGDNIFTIDLSELDGTGIDATQVKAVAQRQGGTDTGFDIQMGGTTDGLTANGNNAAIDPPPFLASTAYRFKVDAISGRIAVGPVSAPPADPTRPAKYFVTSVADWMMLD